jgi:hypothetical protein
MFALLEEKAPKPPLVLKVSWISHQQELAGR